MLIARSIFLNYVTSSDLTRQDIPLFKWPDLLFHNNNQRNIQCTNCQETCRSNSSTSHLCEVLLRFQKVFTLLGEHFQLKAMVRNFAGHFTCALSENDAEKLEYLDDLCETSYYFSNLELLHQRFPRRIVLWCLCSNRKQGKFIDTC